MCNIQRERKKKVSKLVRPKGWPAIFCGFLVIHRASLMHFHYLKVPKLKTKSVCIFFFFFFLLRFQDSKTQLICSIKAVRLWFDWILIDSDKRTQWLSSEFDWNVDKSWLEQGSIHDILSQLSAVNFKPVRRAQTKRQKSLMWHQENFGRRFCVHEAWVISWLKKYIFGDDNKNIALQQNSNKSSVMLRPAG